MFPFPTAQFAIELELLSPNGFLSKRGSYFFFNDFFDTCVVLGLASLADVDVRLRYNFALFGERRNHSRFVDEISISFIFILSLRPWTFLSWLALLVVLCVSEKVL